MNIKEELEKLIDLTKYDVVLVGDGSGTSAGEACAWNCLLYETKTNRETWLNGGLSSGTNNVAELLPYITSLWHYDYLNPGKEIRVCIITDSEFTAKCGDGIYEKKINLAYWKALSYFKDIGYKISWKHIYRNTNCISSFCDKKAGELRKIIKEFNN